jgi:hypothetical protein
MDSRYESFWENDSFAVVGHSDKKRFPHLTYNKLKQLGKRVFPVDPGSGEISGDRTFPDLTSLPESVDAVVLEVPRDEIEEWVGAAADADIADIWIHQKCETPESLALARERDLNLHHGTCAVMYLSHGFSIHAFHGWINRRKGTY